MSQKSSIEWTDATWNPVRGCVKISPGCKHCYAETFAERFRGVPGHPYERGFDPSLVHDTLDAPLHWRKPRRIFVNSMSDMFGEFVPFEYIAAVWGIMAAAPQHTFQVLTKRAERLYAWHEWMWKQWRHAFLRNVWLGVSVEDRKYGLPRIDELRKVPAAVRFLSVEPLLEDLGPIDLTDIHWVVIGGESGHGARECKAAWMRSIVKQCRAQHVPVFVKQGGAAFSDEQHGIAGYSLKVPKEAAALIALRLADRKGGDLLELPEDLRVREVPR